MTQTIHIHGHTFELHPSGAVYWKDRAMLLIADVHFGKVAHFRKHGAAIPAQATRTNFNKLEVLLAVYEPRSICFLGDLFHSSINNEWNFFEEWIGKTNMDVILIQGNHDIIPVYMFEDIGIEVKMQLQLDAFLFTHQPIEDPKLFNIAGHVHPGVRLRGVGRQQHRFSCFYKTKNQLILPAFGAFTGKHIVSPVETDEVFAIADGEVLCVSSQS